MRILSGAKPTGELTLGNYIGMMLPLLQMQQNLKKGDELFLFIANLHSLTTDNLALELEENTKKQLALYVACGFDLRKSKIFVQSEIIEHSALAYIMETTVYFGELSRMIQFKEKKQQQLNNNIRTALFTYPALMAADILLYDADLVVVGKDQQQHLELTTTLAKRFNKKYGDTFLLPKAHINQLGQKIKSLSNPAKKMSKSDVNEKSYIALLDKPENIIEKIKKATTDSEQRICFDKEKQPGIANLLVIFAALEQTTTDQIVKRYQKHTSYKIFKTDLANVIIKTLKPIQEKYYHLMNSTTLEEALARHKKEIRKIAKSKLKQIYKKIGLFI